MTTHRRALATLNLTQLAEASGRDRETVRKALSKAPVIEPVRTDGRSIVYSAPAALERVFCGTDGFDLTAERARLAHEQANGQAFKNAELRDELIRREDAENTWSAHIAACRTKLRAIPKRLIVTVPGFTRSMALPALREIDAALNALAGEASPRRKARGRRSGRKNSTAGAGRA